MITNSHTNNSLKLATLSLSCYGLIEVISKSTMKATAIGWAFRERKLINTLYSAITPQQLQMNLWRIEYNNPMKFHLSLLDILRTHPQHIDKRTDIPIAENKDEISPKTEFFSFYIYTYFFSNGIMRGIIKAISFTLGRCWVDWIIQLDRPQGHLHISSLQGEGPKSAYVLTSLDTAGAFRKTPSI